MSAAKFVWYDVMTTDTEAAEAFYRSVMGWEAKDSGMPGPSYTLLSVGETMVGGLMAIPEDARKAGAGPAWMGYIGVDNVDAMAGRIRAAGGAIHRAPEDIPGVGRFAVAADPHGAGFLIFAPSGGAQSAPVPAGTPGHVGWHELYAGDLESAFAFYSGLFGWTKAEVVQSPAGPYQLFAAGEHPIGGMMTKPSHVPVPCWVYYFNVSTIDAAVGRVKSGGGRTLFDPMQVPGGSWIVQCLDPQGAMFALVAPAR